MLRLISLTLLIAVLHLSSSEREDFKRYKTIEAYEVRPGLLMMPRYSAEGEVCEIVLEGLHYSPEKIRLNSDLSLNEIDPVLEELVPANERGSRSKGLARDHVLAQREMEKGRSPLV